MSTILDIFLLISYICIMGVLKTSAVLDRLEVKEAELSALKITLNEGWENDKTIYNIEMASIIEKEISLLKLIINLDSDEEDC